MEMSMSATDNGSHHAHLLGIAPRISLDIPATMSPVSSQNVHPLPNPARTAYTESQYSQPEEPEPAGRPEHHHPSSSRIFSTNGVQYSTQAYGKILRETSQPEVEVDHEPAAARAVRFDVPEATPAPPWGSCPFPHWLPSGAADDSTPVSKLVSDKTRQLPLGAILNCCLTRRPDTPPMTARGSSHPPSDTVVASKDCSGSHSHSHASGHASGICCSGSHRSSEDSSLKYLGDTATEGDRGDIEPGPPNFERIVLRIDGLKCGCCEGGLSRALSRIPAIRDYSVNIVLARVEFELDTNRLSIDHVVKLLATRTGYNFEEQVTSTGQVLDFIITDPRRLKHAGQPNGVIRTEVPERAPWRPLQALSGRNCTTPRKTSASAIATPPVDDLADPASDGAKRPVAKIRIPPTKIYYDATRIGARDVFKYYQQFDPDLCLAPLGAHPGLDLGARQTRRALKWFIPTLVLTIPVLVFAWMPVEHNYREDLQTPASSNRRENIYNHISLAFASVVQLIAFKEFVPGALRSLYHSRMFEMDFLIAFSTTVAYIFSVVSYVFQIRGKPLETGSFFETSTLLVTLILLGRVINEWARFRAAKSVSFRSLQIDWALLVEPHANTSWPNCKASKVDARLLQYGDVFRIPPHTKVVTDGVVLYGGSNVDESMITGESKPKAKGLASEVFAGTNNGDGMLVVRLTKLTNENSVHQIAAMVEDAELTKPRAQALADRLAGCFVPAIATLGFTVFIIWAFVDRFYNNRSWSQAVITAITYAIATLIVSCPCAIGLAVPMVVLIAGGVAARFGIIFRDPQKLEIARNVTDIVFDKTGTLTSGRMEVVGIPKYRGTDKNRTKGLLMGLLKDIKHPVSAAITHYLAEDRSTNKDFEPLDVVDITSIPGRGVMGTCAHTGVEIRAGNADWLNINVVGLAIHTRCYFTVGGDLRASFELTDRPRPTAETVIEKLYARGIQVHMISGDTEGAVADIAGALRIRESNTKSRCKPEGKMNYVKDLQKPGKVVMFVGDGTNDSVALKQADVGVHVNQGSDVAKSAADVVLMTTRLHDILILLDISGAAYRRIILNFTWSALYNLVAILLAAGAFVKAGDKIRIEPQWAGLGELVSVLPVVLIAFQMRWRNYGSTYRLMETDYQRAEAPKREQRVRKRMSGSSSSESAGCCEVSPTTLAKIDALTRTAKRSSC
ncbi:heavy metal translocatin [Decorospora gaudefroyi]|uniref:Heavy metal translocatin n=1 Tax=Decorospora gaudefroyi TaxID=184978 RepID=A0A6A5KJ55_9PLEO|nr:heavy metal translocatin [Decorospora gaudefroyi]